MSAELPNEACVLLRAPLARSMAFANLTNDFVFRRIFATHPEILRGLLNDLLDRQGDQAINGPGCSCMHRS